VAVTVCIKVGIIGTVGVDAVVPDFRYPRVYEGIGVIAVAANQNIAQGSGAAAAGVIVVPVLIQIHISVENLRILRVFLIDDSIAVVVDVIAEFHSTRIDEFILIVAVTILGGIAIAIDIRERRIGGSAVSGGPVPVSASQIPSISTVPSPHSMPDTSFASTLHPETNIKHVPKNFMVCITF
jgi:hypothetical protein